MRAHKRVHAWANEYPTFGDGANMRARGILAELQAGTEGREEHRRHDDAQGWTSGGQHNMTDRALTWYPFYESCSVHGCRGKAIERAGALRKSTMTLAGSAEQ